MYTLNYSLYLFMVNIYLNLILQWKMYILIVNVVVLLPNCFTNKPHLVHMKCILIGNTVFAFHFLLLNKI